jgi:hypothetical protein
MVVKIEDIKCYDVDEVQIENNNNNVIQFFIRFHGCQTAHRE